MISDRRGRRPTGSRGFTLVELVVVLAILLTVLGTAVPLVGAAIDAQRRDEVVAELDAIGRALENYWYDHQAFPAALTDSDFLGVHLQPGVGGTAVRDGWGGDVTYRYAVDPTALTATVWSRGPDGIDRGAGAEELVVTVSAAVPGLLKTRQRLQVIVEVLAHHVEAGGALTGNWPVDRAAMGLGAEYDRDGFGTTFLLTPSPLSLRSAGVDRRAGTADDLMP